MNALRDRILQLAVDKSRAGYVTPTTNNLYERLAAWYRQRGEVVPISRALFYRWFGSELGDAVAPAARVRSRFRGDPRRRGVRTVRGGRPAASRARRATDDRLRGPAGAPGLPASLPGAHRGGRAELGRGDHRRPYPAPQTRLPGLHLARGTRSLPATAPAFPDRPQAARTRPQQAAQEDGRHRAIAAPRTSRPHPAQRHLRRHLALFRDDVARGERAVESRQACRSRSSCRSRNATGPCPTRSSFPELRVSRILVWRRRGATPSSWRPCSPTRCASAASTCAIRVSAHRTPARREAALLRRPAPRGDRAAGLGDRRGRLVSCQH